MQLKSKSSFPISHKVGNILNFVLAIQIPLLLSHLSTFPINVEKYINTEYVAKFQ